ncbi:MAG: CPBP family intramembrane metalloprotease, partial [Bacteroidetes bacterium]|nr:CPBP family intramembrane metalloprotease [Bacteroidota bacterium]
MINRLRREWQTFLAGARKLDRQMVVVLVAAVALVFLQLQFGNRRFFWDHISDAVDPANQELFAWIWWFGIQGITGFVIPILILTLGFKRKPSEIGLGLGDWKLASTLALAYAVHVII